MHTASTLRNHLGIVRVRFRFFTLRLPEERDKEEEGLRLGVFLLLVDKI